MSSKRIYGVAAVLVLAACSDSSGPDGGLKRVTLSFSANSQSAAAVRTASFRSSPSALMVAGTGGVLIINRVQLVLSELELERAGIAGCDGDDDDLCEGEELEFGPMLVDFPVNGTLTTPVSVEIPAGRYTELEYEIEAPESGESGVSAFLAANPGFQGVSIRVEGTFNGEPFIYVTDLEAEVELEFAPPLEIGADASNITVNADMSRWFLDASGRVIDPNTANRGGTNESLVENNIESSFSAFDDDDRDGHDDGDD